MDNQAKTYFIDCIKQHWQEDKEDMVFFEGLARANRNNPEVKKAMLDVVDVLRMSSR